MHAVSSLTTRATLAARALSATLLILAACRSAEPESTSAAAVAQDEGGKRPPAAPTREFEIRGDRAYLGGVEVDLWGLRCGNALYSPGVTERHVRALDTMVRHGINLIGVYVQGSNGGWPDADAGLNGYTRAGALKPEVAARLEWLVREADARGMVVQVGLFSPRKDQELDGDAAVQRAIEETGRFLVDRGLRNVFVDIMHEFDHTERADLDLLREPDGATKKARLASWFHAVAPDIEVGVCPYEKSRTADTFPGMDVRIVQKSMAIPTSGFVVNVESQKMDSYENDGVFSPGDVDRILDDCERYHAAPNAAIMFHAAYVLGIGGFSGTAPHPEPGGKGSSPSDRGVRCYFEWVRDHIGRWEYPRHVRATAPPESAGSAMAAVPTREFEVRGDLPFLGGQPVVLWGLRCNNALLSDALVDRLVNNFDNMAAHGINLISLSLQGTNGGFPDVNAGPNAFTPDGRLIRGFKTRLERVVREADRRGMVVCVGILMPRKDEYLRDESAVQNAVEETGRFLEERSLRNVMVNLFQEFNHPTRIDHEILREPDGERKKAQLAAWFKAQAPGIEVGIVSNHLTGAVVGFPGCDVMMLHEDVPWPTTGFVLNTESPDEEIPGDEGIFHAFERKRQEDGWRRYLGSPRTAMLYRSPYVEDVRGKEGTGPHFEMGGGGTGESDRGVRTYFEWVRNHVGRWEYPRHLPRDSTPLPGTERP
jgi:hypothetical protein